MRERLFSDLGAVAAKDPIQAERERMNGGGSHNDAAEVYLRQEQALQEAVEQLKREMSPEGVLGLPPALEKKRLQNLIPDGAFKLEPLYDWCFVYQTARFDIEGNEKWGKTGIYKTQNAQKLGEHESPRGILVAAGLGALDTLSSHGICLGDHVFIVRNAPWEIQCDVVGAKKFYVRACRDADLLAGEDLSKRLRSGELVRKSKIVKTEQNPDGQLVHYYETKDGKPLNPVTPAIPDDL